MAASKHSTCAIAGQKHVFSTHDSWTGPRDRTNVIVRLDEWGRFPRNFDLSWLAKVDDGGATSANAATKILSAGQPRAARLTAAECDVPR